MNTPDRKPASILVVDDTQANLQLLIGVLQKNGYKVRPVTNGPHALRAARANPPDLILLDITMPEMDGYEVCRRLKAEPITADIPVLFLSALTEVEDRVRGFEVGGLDYVGKPFQLPEVLARVHTHLQLHRQKLELEQSLSRQRELEKLRDQLTHMIAHDMRSPLLGLRLTMDLLQQLKLGAEYVDLLGEAQGSLNSLIEMVSQMLDVSRLEAGALQLNLTPVDLAQTAQRVVTATRRLARDLDVRLEADGAVMVSVDNDLIARVIGNLLGNAYKFAATRGRVIVRVKGEPGTARCEVQDDGRGIAPENQARIFEKFAQVEGPMKRSGSGLGLTFAKMAIEAHGGTIGVHSVLDHGSTFWFTLPIAANPQPSTGPSS